MEASLEVIVKNNVKQWNSTLLKLKEKQQITKNYLTSSIKNIHITNETLRKLGIFLNEAHANPEFIDQILAQFEKEQEASNSSVCFGGLIHSYLPFMIPNLKLLSKSPNRTFVYKLFDMVSDPSTDAIILWSKSGTSFFIKDKDGLHNHIQERFDHNIGTFYKTLGEFGFQCVDKFLHEYANKYFQRDNKDILKNIKSRRKLWLAKNNMQSDMEEEVKRLKFFQDSLKAHIPNIKEKEQITKCNLLDVKRCLESASMRIATKVNEKKKLEQDQPKYSIPKGIEKLAARKDGRRPWSDPMQVYVDIEKLQQDLSKLNVQILNLEQGQVFVEDQLAAIEKNLPDTEIKQKEIEVSMNKLFNNSKAIPRKRSRKTQKKEKQSSEDEKAHNSKAMPRKQSRNNQKKEKQSSEDEKAQANDSNDQSTDNEDLSRNIESPEPDSHVYHPKESYSSSVTDLEDEDLTLFVEMLEDDLTRNLESPEPDSQGYHPKKNDSSSVTDLKDEDVMLFVGMLEDDLTFSW